jgi:hypothetical protein
MKVYLDVDGERRLVGRADVPENAGPVFRAPMFGAASIIVEPFVVGAVTRPPEGGAPVVERAVLAAPGQLVELLPGWVPLAPQPARSAPDAPRPPFTSPVATAPTCRARPGSAASRPRRPSDT